MIHFRREQNRFHIGRLTLVRMELTAIPGVGEKTAAALAELENPETAIERGDVAAIARAPGIPPARAARIARGAIRDRHGETGSFLATDRAREIYDSILALLQDHAITDYGRHRLRTFYPSTAESRIDEARAIADRAMDRDLDETVDELLHGVEPIREPTGLRVRDRCLATRDAERYAAAQDSIPELSIEVVENQRGLADLAKGYSTVIVLDEAFAGLDLDGAIEVRPDALEAPAAVVPERTLSFFGTNRTSIRAAIDVHRQTSLDPPTDLDRLETLLDRIHEDGTPVGDDELERLATARDDLDAAVHTAESVATDRLREAIRDRGVTIAGDDLLSLVERGAGIDTVLARELDEEFSEAVSAARDHLVDALSLSPDEAEYADRIIPETPAFPVEHNEEAAASLHESLQRAHDRRAASIKRQLASDLAAERDATITLVRQALELDVELAISRFARSFDCTMPDIGGSGIAIEGGRSPLLDEPPENIQPVDYGVEDVVLLSGVNSGGKTALLDLLAATTILAHMGLPVPATSARVERFDALHYHAATQGTLDAGAFESTLQEFANLATAPEGCLVLVDELESITEPGAAATIVAGVLEELADGATAVFVSRLAAEIRDAAGSDLRVDGIVADGIDDGALVVDRTPVRDHLARSTPELIVEGLSETASDETGAFYDRLLEKFD